MTLNLFIYLIYVIMINKDNYFAELSKIWVELSKKWQLNYSSWADVWAELKKNVPDVKYEWIENKDWTLWFVDDYWCFAKVRVISDTLWVDLIQHLQAQDFKNQSIKKDKLSSNDINKTYQRCLVKAIATWFGLWLYIYKGEDLPADEEKPPKKEQKAVFKITDENLEWIRNKMLTQKLTPAEVLKTMETKFSLSDEDKQKILNLF